MKHTLLILAVAFGFASCKKPSACIEASATSADLGQPVIFTDCSEDAHKIIIDLPDGKRLEDPGPSFSYMFERPGPQIVTLTAYSKNEKKDDQVAVTVNVAYPQKTQFVGTWHYYKSMEYADVWFGGTQLIDTYTYNDYYEFTSVDMLLINGSYADDYVFSSSLGQVTYYGTTYNIIKLGANDMVLRDNSDGPGWYTNHYFSR